MAERTSVTSRFPTARQHEEYKEVKAAVKNLKEQLNAFKGVLDVSVLGELRQSLEHVAQEAQNLEDAYLTDMRAVVDDVTGLTQGFREQIQRLTALIEKLVARLAAITSPPLGRVTFIRFLKMESHEGKEFPLIEVRDSNGKYASVFFLVEDYDYQMLRYGQILETPSVTTASHVVGVRDEFSVHGAEMFITETLEKDREGMRFLASGVDRDDSLMVHAAHTVTANVIEIGTRVLVDTTAGLIVETLPEKENQRFLVGEIPQVTFADIGGHEEMIRWIRDELANPFLYGDLYEKVGLHPPRGFVMHGPPGVGKTMIAKAIVNFMNGMLSRERGEAHGHFLHIKGPELQHWLVGRTEYMMRQIFDQARKVASPTSPVIMFFDEAESMFPVRGSGISSDVEKTNVAQFISLLDGLEERGNIIVVLATNRFDLIDRAVTRPGRCDRVLRIPRPDKESARAIFRLYLKSTEEVIHSKYLVPVYTPVDREGRGRVDENNQPIRLKFDSDPRKVVEYLIDRVVLRMYDDKRSSNLFIRVKFYGDEKSQDYTYGDFVSGAMIANIVERAKRRMILRHVAHEKKEPLGIELSDLFQAVEEAFSELRSPADLCEFANWFHIEGHGSGKTVQQFAFLHADATMSVEE